LLLWSHILWKDGRIYFGKKENPKGTQNVIEEATLLIVKDNDTGRARENVKKMETFLYIDNVLDKVGSNIIDSQRR